MDRDSRIEVQDS